MRDFTTTWRSNWVSILTIQSNKTRRRSCRLTAAPHPAPAAVCSNLNYTTAVLLQQRFLPLRVVHGKLLLLPPPPPLLLLMLLLEWYHWQPALHCSYYLQLCARSYPGFLRSTGETAFIRSFDRTNTTTQDSSIGGHTTPLCAPNWKIEHGHRRTDERAHGANPWSLTDTLKAQTHTHTNRGKCKSVSEWCGLNLDEHGESLSVQRAHFLFQLSRELGIVAQLKHKGSRPKPAQLCPN